MECSTEVCLYISSFQFTVQYLIPYALCSTSHDRAGSVIIVYGVGSKHRVLERFVDLHLADSPVVVVCGYKTNISMKHIFSGFMHLVGEVTAHSPQEIAMEINVKLQCVPCTVFLVIHSLDGLYHHNYSL